MTVIKILTRIKMQKIHVFIMKIFNVEEKTRHHEQKTPGFNEGIMRRQCALPT